jgi:hypothetical protein
VPRPHGYKLLSLSPGYPIAAVPDGWTVRKIDPGGSSWQYVARDPYRPRISLDVQVNACYSCAEPAFGLGVQSMDSPGAPGGRWISDHVTAGPPTSKGELIGETLTAVWPSGGSGDVVVRWVAPKQVSQILWKTFVASWRVDASYLPM